MIREGEYRYQGNYAATWDILKAKKSDEGEDPVSSDTELLLAICVRRGRVKREVLRNRESVRLPGIYAMQGKVMRQGISIPEEKCDLLKNVATGFLS